MVSYHYPLLVVGCFPATNSIATGSASAFVFVAPIVWRVKTQCMKIQRVKTQRMKTQRLKTQCMKIWCMKTRYI